MFNEKDAFYFWSTAEHFQIESLKTEQPKAMTGKEKKWLKFSTPAYH